MVLEVTLYLADRCTPVIRVELPVMRAMPDVIVWRRRVFVLRLEHGDPKYVEGTFLMVR